MHQKQGLLLLLGTFFSGIPFAHAHCPLCTVAIGAGVLGARAIGLSDGIVGLFVGAFAVSTGIWVSRKLGKKIPLQTPLLVGSSWVLTIFPLQAMSNELVYLPLFWLGQNGSMLNKVYFPTLFLAGGIMGALISLLALHAHEWLKRKHGKVFVPFQGVWLTLSFLVIASLLLVAGGF